MALGGAGARTAHPAAQTGNTGRLAEDNGQRQTGCSSRATADYPTTGISGSTRVLDRAIWLAYSPPVAWIASGQVPRDHVAGPEHTAIVWSLQGKKKNLARMVIHLECTESRNLDVPGVSRYTTKKNKKNTPKRLEG